MGTSNSTSNSHNVAFLSSSSTNSTSRAVNTALGVNTVSTQGVADSSTTIEILSDAPLPANQFLHHSSANSWQRDLHSSGSGNTLHWQWELILPVGTLSPGSGNALCILFPTIES
nr:hypothetical protein [Tanacetum cinerariifolium]